MFDRERTLDGGSLIKRSYTKDTRFSNLVQDAFGGTTRFYEILT